MESNEQRPIERSNIKLSMKPGVMFLSSHEGALNVLPALERAVIDLSSEGIFVTLTLSVDMPELEDLPVSRVGVTGDPLEGITAADLDAVAAYAGMSEGPGSSILAHLRARLSSPQ